MPVLAPTYAVALLAILVAANAAAALIAFVRRLDPPDVVEPAPDRHVDVAA
jgi:hypothetical protein